MEYILIKLKEKSTYLGLLSILGALGLSLKPEYAQEIITAGMGIAGLALVWYKEYKAKKK